MFQRWYSQKIQRLGHGSILPIMQSTMMCFGRKLPTQAEAELVWELASPTDLRPLAFVRLGALAIWAAAVVLALLVAARAVGLVALSGTALSEHLVVRVKTG